MDEGTWKKEEVSLAMGFSHYEDMGKDGQSLGNFTIDDDDT